MEQRRRYKERRWAGFWLGDPNGVGDDGRGL